MIDSRDFLAARRRAENRDAAAARTRRSPSPAGSTSTTHHADLGPSRQGPRQASRHGAAASAARRRAPSASPPAGPTIARSRRSHSSPTGPGTARPRRSSATTRSLMSPADRRHRLPGHWHPGQSRRQGEKARHTRLGVWRRVSAALLVNLQPATRFRADARSILDWPYRASRCCDFCSNWRRGGDERRGRYIHANGAITIAVRGRGYAPNWYSRQPRRRDNPSPSSSSHRYVRIGTLKEGSSSLSKKSFGFPRMLAQSSRGSGPTCTRAGSCDPSG